MRIGETPTIPITIDNAPIYNEVIISFKGSNGIVIKANPTKENTTFLCTLTQDDTETLGVGVINVEANFITGDNNASVKTSTGNLYMSDSQYTIETEAVGGSDVNNINLVVETPVIFVEDGAGGTTDHNKLRNRELFDQHPISAITALQEAVDKANVSISEQEADSRYENKIAEKGTAFNVNFGEVLGTVVEGNRVLKDVPADAEFTDTKYDTEIAVINSDIQQVEVGLTTKANISSVPTKVSQLSQDVEYITNSVNDLVNYYTKSDTMTTVQIQELFSTSTSLEWRVVTELPPVDQGESGVIYLIAVGEPSDPDYYQEYYFHDGRYDLFGKTSVNLSDYYTKTEVDNIVTNIISQLNNKADKATTENAISVLESSLNNKTDKTYVDGEIDNVNVSLLSKADTTYVNTELNKKLNIADAPTSLKNPYPIRFQGAIIGSYDGSEEKVFTIPSGGSGGTTNHAKLTNLDYANSGHTGFATSEQGALADSAVQVEQDPTVPSWAKQPNKPTYTAQEVGALPDSTVIPTNNNQLENGRGFITNLVENLVNYYKKSETMSREQILEQIAGINNWKTIFVNELPATGETNTIYFVPSENPTVQDEKDEFMWNETDSKFERIGATAISLDGLVTSEQLTTALNNYYTKSQADTQYEPKRTTNGTAYNKNFGITAGTVVEGNRVLTDVPSGAKFTDTTYNTEIEAINTELESKADIVYVDTELSKKANTSDIPTELPNPNALTFTGAVSGVYDGATPLTVNVPSGGGGSTTPLNNKSILFIGDSQLELGQFGDPRGWGVPLKTILGLGDVKYTAVTGATLSDKASTVLDGNPLYSNPTNNTVSNQIQKIKNNPDDFANHYDIICVAAGINDIMTNLQSQTYTTQDIADSIYTQGSTWPFDPAPVDSVNRKKWPGAIRYIIQNLQTLYPNSAIFFFGMYNLPIKSGANTNEMVTWREQLSYLCDLNSTKFVDQSKCGFYFADSQTGNPYLFDGLHTSELGAKILAGYNASILSNEANYIHNKNGTVYSEGAQINVIGAGGGSTILPTGDEWLRKTGITHPEWGYEYEYYKWLPKLPDALGVGWDMIKELGTTVTQLSRVNVIATTDPSATHQNKYDNYQGVNSVKEALHCYAQLGKVNGIFSVYLHATTPFKEKPIQVFFRYFDTSDLETTQVAQMAMLQNEINDGTQALNILGVTT